MSQRDLSFKSTANRPAYMRKSKRLYNWVLLKAQKKHCRARNQKLKICPVKSQVCPHFISLQLTLSDSCEICPSAISASCTWLIVYKPNKLDKELKILWSFPGTVEWFTYFRSDLKQATNQTPNAQCSDPIWPCTLEQPRNVSDLDPRNFTEVQYSKIRHLPAESRYNTP
jgi:hypothetical protein